MQSKHQNEINQFRITYSRAGSLTAAVLVFLGLGLDYFIYPNQFLPFLGIRILVTALTIATFFSLGTKAGFAHVKSLTFFWLFIPQIMICWMINCTEGVHSIYFIGLNLAIYAIGVFLPLSVMEGLFFNTLTVLLYMAACYFHPSIESGTRLLLGNSLFLILSAGAAIVTTHFNTQQRNKLFALQDEIKAKNISLEQSNRSLAEVKGHMIQQEKMSALGTLSAGLLHELNNPVNYSMMAIGMAEMEPETKSNNMLKESLADAKEGMTRVRDIVTDLKTFAYQKPGEDTHRTFLFENALRSALRLSGFELKDITVQQDLPLDTHVQGDEPAMIGVLINLVTNAALALKKSERNNQLIQIKAWQAQTGKDSSARLYVTVRDNGTGIKPENLTRVFEPFFTTRDVGHGLGLGLAVSYAIIQRHGSELTVTSLEGEWTEFAFDLPAGNN
jgi:two-component system sensor histidine kinase PhcS